MAPRPGFEERLLERVTDASPKQPSRRRDESAPRPSGSDGSVSRAGRGGADGPGYSFQGGRWGFALRVFCVALGPRPGNTSTLLPALACETRCPGDDGAARRLVCLGGPGGVRGSVAHCRRVHGQEQSADWKWSRRPLIWRKSLSKNGLSTLVGLKGRWQAGLRARKIWKSQLPASELGFPVVEGARLSARKLRHLLSPTFLRGVGLRGIGGYAGSGPMRCWGPVWGRKQCAVGGLGHWKPVWCQGPVWGWVSWGVGSCAVLRTRVGLGMVHGQGPVWGWGRCGVGGRVESGAEQGPGP